MNEAPAMRELLVINPNTSTAVTALLREHVQEELGRKVRVRAVTARFGAPYIIDEASYAVAGHATLDAWAAALAQAGPGPHAVLVGCFGDPGLLALRESSPVPVTGLAEAAFIEAARHGRFAVVTGGERWAPMLRRLAEALGHGGSLAGIETVAPTGADLVSDPAGARMLLAQACREAARKFGARAVILGGAGLAGIAAMLQPELDVPLIDSVLAGARWALRAPPPSTDRAAPGFDVRWGHVSPELEALGR
ncbi:MAG: Asp/Glu racemase [Ramlibacter sp.]|nr:Asp/Glu racemase [Ramlibacter sp.]